jgi:hypothetical protein
MYCIGPDGFYTQYDLPFFGDIYQGNPNYLADSLSPGGLLLVAGMLITFPNSVGNYCQSGGPTSFTIVTGYWDVFVLYALDINQIACMTALTLPWVATFVNNVYPGVGTIGPPVTAGNYNEYACQWPNSVSIGPA